ncbi:hypothetical protein BDY19DRAFT_927585 [Irpex rosettiformis]|uniref:Uncharacterized protein n=1 Tax=Irpex rosettiformis TaxID=378272 RepID=A0ACB8UCF9_9APHY|nr:hypothetical protein BDY19DRAFT_927585 [Irpex rosettiformis]
MCVVVGSIEHATSTCRMCKAFKPQSGRCPHVSETCRNRVHHPGYQVSHFKNAEVASFNTCGYCRWAKANPNAKPTQNTGWPGCCRAPTPAEYKLVQIADWPSVSAMHNIPIPHEVKSILDSIGFQRMATFANNSTNTRGAMPPSQPPSMSRRSSAVVASALRSEVTPVKSHSLPIPARLKGGSPQQTASSLTTSSRPSGEPSPSSAASANGMDQIVLPRRPIVETQPERRRDNSRESKQSPSRKNVDLTGTLSRKGGSQRPPLSNVISPKNPVEAQSQPQSRKGSGNNPSPPPSHTPRNVDRGHERSNSTATLRQRSPLELDVSSLSISSGSSSASSDSGDGSETTVISDGGFTDYLSDESEAELQRQAEVRAAIIAQTQVEEQEFRAARQQLANIDLRPPKSWTSNVSTPRLQSSTSSGNGSYGSQYSTPSYPGQTASQSRV